MGRAVQEVRSEIIQNVIAHVREKLPAKQAPFVERFVRQYFNWVSTEDLTSRSEMDLYGAALSHWLFLNQRKPQEVHIRVYNPQYAQHGWQSAHTIVEISRTELPFLVDSLRQEIARQGLAIHMLIYPGSMYFKRDRNGRIISVLDASDAAQDPDVIPEFALYVEIDKQTDQQALHALESRLSAVLSDVDVAVTDWDQMRQQLLAVGTEWAHHPAGWDPETVQESLDFIQWLAHDNFTFLGAWDEYIDPADPAPTSRYVSDSGLGLLRENRPEQARLLAALSHPMPLSGSEPTILTIAKTHCRSTVHRASYMDYIAIRRLDPQGRSMGQRCVVGLYTANAYNSSPRDIPFLRHKVRAILDRCGFSQKEHSERELLNILSNFPRDDLFQGHVEELAEMAMGILHLHERKKIRLFVREDIYGRFFSCLVYVPKDVFHSELRERFGEILLKALGGSEIHFSTQFTESVLARIHFMVHLPADQPFPVCHVVELEKKLGEAARTWQDDFKEALLELLGEERGNMLFNRYGQAFPAGYREYYPPKTAVFDLEQVENLHHPHSLRMSFYRPLEATEGRIRFKLFRLHAPLPLSDVMPILENMGMRVLSEHSYELLLKTGQSVWINDFEMVHQWGGQLDVDQVRVPFQECFYRAWIGAVENDALNKLVLNAGLSWREATILRAYARYFRQIGFTLSLNYIHDTLNRHPHIAAALVALFQAHFDTDRPADPPAVIKQIQQQIYADLEQVSNLDEDRILRRYLDVILATVRTNYYQHDTTTGQYKDYVSFKLLPARIPDMPLPRPMFEIFVYAPFVEGVHLRAHDVARGGLRWSDRREDYRTEILGLMKAQQVKNAIIVPAGAKGGFVPQNLPTDGNREAIMAEVVRCYQTFIRGLLDITDNLHDREVIPPPEVVRWDGDDPYLVVAADKGTATFSDIANALSQEYGFWLGDAFASGGSSGYDHKKMGITARGAWESVRRHFHELGIDVQNEDFTVLGIGDMAGDVFGNGMLQSKHIRLVAAFNHQHIFLDPYPDAERSYQERERLFRLPRSTWADYDPQCLSPGGGIYSRQAKSIRVSPQVMERFQLAKDTFVPNELIKALLQAPVDLLWNGGIGTYIKASTESHTDVGDRSNDGVRVNARDLQCRVIGEGGNLGVTQLGRVEYAMHGGIGFTDFIDNVGGVNCSDHEVNIKILLNDVVRNGDLTEKQRNQLLGAMTEEVGRLVIADSYAQTRAISLAASRAEHTLDEYRLFIHELERQGQLDRALEYLPSDEALLERKATGKGLTRPEIAVLFAYSKIQVKQALIGSDLLADPAVLPALEAEFPAPLRVQFYPQMLQHKLKADIIATRLSSTMINTMGFTFAKRLYDETGASVVDVTRAFLIAQDVLDMAAWSQEIEDLGHRVDAAIQQNMGLELTRLIRRVTRWFLRNRRMQLDITPLVQQFKPPVQVFCAGLPGILPADEQERYQAQINRLEGAGVSPGLAAKMALCRFLYSAMDVIEVAALHQLPVMDVAAVYFSLGARLELGWFREQINLHPVDDNWDALARAACRDDIDHQQRHIALSVLKFSGPADTLESKIERWSAYHQPLIYRWYGMLADLRATKSKEFTIFAVALRELLDLAQTSQNAVIS